MSFVFDIAITWLAPPDTIDIPVKYVPSLDLTWTGVEIVAVVLSLPNWPYVLSPHAYTLRSLVVTTEKFSPADNASTFFIYLSSALPVSYSPFNTLSGVCISLYVLLTPFVLWPSWPLLLRPHDHTLPSVLTASECSAPAPIRITSVK